MKKQYHSTKSKTTNKTISKTSFTKNGIPIDINIIDDKNKPFFNFKMKDGYEVKKKDGI